MSAAKSQKKAKTGKGAFTQGAPNPRRRPYTLTINETLKEADIEKAMNLLTDLVEKRKARNVSEN